MKSGTITRLLIKRVMKLSKTSSLSLIFLTMLYGFFSQLFIFCFTLLLLPLFAPIMYLTLLWGYDQKTYPYCRKLELSWMSINFRDFYKITKKRMPLAAGRMSLDTVICNSAYEAAFENCIIPLRNKISLSFIDFSNPFCVLIGFSELLMAAVTT